MLSQSWRLAGLFCLVVSAAQVGVSGQDSGTDTYTPYVAEESGDQRFANWSFQNADVRSVFANLSSVSGVDIVVEPNVDGKVTLKVTNKSWKEVFNVVCKLQNLAATKEEGYIYVMRDADFRKQQLETATADQAVEQMRPLQREVVKLINIKAQDMKEPVTQLLSARGKLTVVEHNNSLIVYDTDKNIEQIRTMLVKLDLETEQVSISAKIIEVSSGTLNNLGVQWSVMGTPGGTEAGATHLDGSSVVEGALDKVFFGVLGRDQLSGMLEMLFTDNKAEVVAQPQITTLDNKEAKIFMGEQVPIKYLDEAKNVLIQMVDAGTEMTVTPHITGNGRVMLQLNPKKKSYTLNDGNPIISEQSAMTNVVVNDGETVVIAGLTSNEETQTEGGIPFLKDIPILGHLFKKSQKKHDKKDLIFFVTPHIISKTIEKVSVEGGAGATNVTQ
jgi:type II secretory pathway component GspD/PulD (secretin)